MTEVLSWIEQESGLADLPEDTSNQTLIQNRYSISPCILPSVSQSRDIEAISDNSDLIGCLSLELFVVIYFSTVIHSGTTEEETRR